MLDLRKALISILLGLVAFAGSFLTLVFSVPPFSISINWFDSLPLLAAMAFGGRYGLLATTVGLGAFYPFFIWGNNGWACLVTCILLIGWPTTVGWLRRVRERKPAFWNNHALIYLASVMLFCLFTWLFFPLAFYLNPPFWNPSAELSMDQAVLNSIVIKGFVVFLAIIFFVDLVLKLPVLRSVLGLAPRKESRYNGRTFVAIFAGSLLVWLVFITFNRTLLLEGQNPDFLQITDPHEIIALLVILFADVFIASALILYLESRIRAEDFITVNQERLALAVKSASIGIWDWDVTEDRLVWDDSMYVLYGVDKASFSSAYDAWIRTLHPEDRGMAEEASKAALRGERDYDPVFRILRASGEVRTIEADALTIRDKQGKAIRQIGVNVDITERKKAEEELNRSLREKEILLRELYHRTKNTMQVVRSMVLTSFGVTGNKIAVDFAIEAKELLLDSAIPLGLILNELLTNSLKYAFPGDRVGRISIAFAISAPGILRLTYRDDGIGFPEGFDFRTHGTLGFNLFHGIVEQQMMGSVEFRSGNGASCTLEFPEGLYSERV